MTCITPRALALETIALLNPDSCHAIAEASEAGTPLRLATAAMSDERHPARRGVRSRLRNGRRGGRGLRGPAGAGDPVGSLRTVPDRSIPLGSRPFIEAMALIGTRAVAAMADRESPGRTV